MFILMVFCLTVGGISASAEIHSEQCGDNAAWYYDDETGTLTIKGEGPMWDCGEGRDFTPYDNDIKHIIIEEGITRLGDNVFRADWYEFNYVEDISFPDSLEEIGAYACADIDVEEFELPKNLKIIDYRAFVGSRKEHWDIPASVTYIGRQAFYASRMKSVNLPEGLETIGEYAFDSTKLEYIEIPSGTIDIRKGAFYNCQKLKSIKLPEGLTSMGYGMFNYCIELESVTIPKSVTSIGERAFLDCKKLKDVYFEGTWEEWENISVDIFNDSLSSANIHTANGHIISALLRDVGSDSWLTVRLDDEAEKRVIIAQGFDGDKQTGIKIVKNHTAFFPAGTDSVKLFYWDSLTSMSPASTVKVVGVMEKAKIENITVSQTPESVNKADNMLDGNMNTVWASTGKATAVADLGKVRKAHKVNVYLKKYEDNRTLPLKIEISADGEKWEEGLDLTIGSNTRYAAELDIYEDIRYVRISVNGNSVSNWASVAEVEVWAEKE